MRRMHQCAIVFGAIVVGSVLISRMDFFRSRKEQSMLRPIQELRVRIASNTRFPEPANIESTGDWYFLDHVSSGLSAFDNRLKKFVPLLAESWSTNSSGDHIFKLKSGIKFHDGTPITAKDVIWTLKRHLILQSSTHFPLWEYIVDCEKVKTLNDECSGLKAISDTEVLIRLKSQTDSFFLQLASPETGIWAASDIDPQTAKLTPTKFSGAYYLEGRDETQALLVRNQNSPMSEQFPNSPRKIKLKAISTANLDDALLKNEVDVVIRPHNPLDEKDWKSQSIGTRSSTPSTLIYFSGLGVGQRPPIGRDFIETAWKINQDSVLTAAESFLPFATNYGLTREEFLSQLPAKTASHLKVLCPVGLFPKAFLDQLEAAGRTVGSKIEFTFLPVAEWFKAFNDPKASEKYDYILTSYAASERYPAVQLRFITTDLVEPTIDLKLAESPDLGTNGFSILRDYQKWLLQVRQAIPVYFNVSMFLFQKNIDLGDQPSSDAEIELWRVQEITQK